MTSRSNTSAFPGTGTQTFTGTINRIAEGSGNTGLTIASGTVEIGGAGTFASGFPNMIVNNGTFKYNSTANSASPK